MIFDWLFKRIKKSKNKEAIVPVFVDVPTREDLIKNNQTEMITLLDQYKKEYKDKLNKRLLFGDISSENLSKKYLENQEIIIKHIMSNNYTGINEILANGSTEELLEAKLEYLKLYILNEENNKIHNEMLLRYMALTEIKKKSYFIRPTQRRAISNELDFLHCSLVVCKSNNFATNTDCKLYLIRINEINKYINNLSDEETRLLNNRKRLVIKLANTFIKDKYDSILGSNMQDLGIISYLEIELEKYYLKHRKELESLDEELDKFDEQEITSDNKEELLKKIELLESNYLLFNMFNEVPKTTYERLYKIKFSILTYGINCFGESVISKEDFGYEYYKNIVEEKINLLLSGNNQNFNDLFVSLRDKRYLINFYSKGFFKNTEESLNSSFKLSILLSFDKENGFDDLLNNTLVNKNNSKAMSLIICHYDLEEYDIFFHSKCSTSSNDIEWDDNIPLKSILEVIRRKEASGRFETITTFYSRSNLSLPHNQLPEGIIKFSTIDKYYPVNNIYTYWPDSDSYNVLPPCEESSLVEFKLPRTIKEFNNCGTSHYYVRELPFGIEKITFATDQDIPPIPPTVNEILLISRSVNRSNPLVLRFLDFKNSAFLKKRTNFINLINALRLAGVTRVAIRLHGDEKITTIEMCNLNTNTVVIENGSSTSYFNGGSKYEDFLNEIYYKKIRRKLNHDSNNEKKENKQKIKKKIY